MVPFLFNVRFSAGTRVMFPRFRLSLTLVVTVFALSLAGPLQKRVTLPSRLFRALFQTQCCLFSAVEASCSPVFSERMAFPCSVHINQPRPPAACCFMGSLSPGEDFYWGGGVGRTKVNALSCWDVSRQRSLSDGSPCGLWCPTMPAESGFQ